MKIYWEPWNSFYKDWVRYTFNAKGYIEIYDAKEDVIEEEVEKKPTPKKKKSLKSKKK